MSLLFLSLRVCDLGCADFVCFFVLGTSRLDWCSLFLSLLLLGAVTVIVPRAPAWVHLHVQLALQPRLLVILGLLLAAQRVPLHNHTVISTPQHTRAFTPYKEHSIHILFLDHNKRKDNNRTENGTAIERCKNLILSIFDFNKDVMMILMKNCSYNCSLK